MIKTIILDPGHGGLNENGDYVTAPAKMFKFPDGVVAYEGVINREFAKLIAEELECLPNTGTTFTVQPDNPADISLSDRVKFEKSFKDSIFVSIHCNAGGGTGFEVFTSKGETKSDKLAEAIIESMMPVYQRYNLPLRADNRDGDRDKEENFYVLKNTKGIAVLLELGFFDNRKDFNLLIDSKFQKEVSKAIATGIIKFIEDESK